MSLNFEHTFGKPQANNSSKDDRPKAQFWLNIGYPVTVKTESGEEQRFVSLGIAHGRVVVLVWTEREDEPRLISCREAEPHERKTYFEAFPLH